MPVSVSELILYHQCFQPGQFMLGSLKYTFARPVIRRPKRPHLAVLVKGGATTRGRLPDGEGFTVAPVIFTANVVNGLIFEGPAIEELMQYALDLGPNTEQFKASIGPLVEPYISYVHKHLYSR